jgi:hypothetical protein
MIERLENSAEWLKDVEPTYSGPGGKAWRFVKPPADDNPRQQITVGDSWLVFAPEAHPLWSWHAIMAVALRDVEGLAPANKSYPEAEFEIMIFALNPERPLPDPRVWPEPGDLSVLEPEDVAVQFDGVTDAQAAEILELCARACTAGYLVPDSDYRTAWKDSIAATVSHYAEGRH